MRNQTSVTDVFSMILIFSILILSGCGPSPDSRTENPFCLAVHGGAGTILKENMTPELESEYRTKLKEALQAGYDILKNNGSSLDAVQAAITILEDSPLFNAGKGAVFTNAGTNELDSSIMDGKTLNAGAVTGVKTIKNPIACARLVMEKSTHVLLAGEGAEQFAKENGLEMVSQDYFFSEKRWQQFQKRLEKETEQAFQDSDEAPRPTAGKFGTVGCVALDRNGNLAAGTSTGGMTNKRFGRVGDSPIIGAGIYANNETCAVSATGTGEYFMRTVAAFDIHAEMAYNERSIESAADKVIMEKLTQLGGTGGVIALDRRGHIAMPFNTAGMYRGYVDKNGAKSLKIYKDE